MSNAERTPSIKGELPVARQGPVPPSIVPSAGQILCFGRWRMTVGQAQAASLLLLFLVAGWLFFANLGNRCLWQDEAQTAMVAKTIFIYGIPHGYDGKNSFSQEGGREFGRNYVYRWHTWFPFYLVAGCFALLGTNTLVARLPFALLGWACVPLIYFYARLLWQSRRAALLAAMLLMTCVPFLLLSRQCRYYSPCVFFSLLGLFAYHQMLLRRRWAGPLFVVAATLLFQSLFLYWGTLLAVVLGHAVLYHRDRLAAVAGWSFCTLLLALPWLIWLFSPPAAGTYDTDGMHVPPPFILAYRYLVQVFQHLFSPILVLVGAVLLMVKRLRGKAPLLDPATRQAVVLLCLVVAVNVIAPAVLTPMYHFRYIAPIIPALCLLAARILDSALRLHPVFGIAAMMAIVFFSPLDKYLYEITHRYHGPLEAMVEFFKTRAKPGDTVAISWGDMPLKFYTDMRVVGGLTGEDLSPARQARWVIIRDGYLSPLDLKVVNYLSTLPLETYRSHRLYFPDDFFDNTESPDMHVYRRMPPGKTQDGPLVVLERIAK